MLNRDPTDTEVRPRDTQTVDIALGQSATVFTSALSGGTVAALLCRHADGTRGVTLSPYCPMLANEPLGKLEDARNTSSHAPGGARIQHALDVLGLGESVEDAGAAWVWRVGKEEATGVAARHKIVQARLPDVQVKALAFRGGAPM